MSADQDALTADEETEWVDSAATAEERERPLDEDDQDIRVVRTACGKMPA